MKVILLCDVPEKGRQGEVIEVSAGYAQNFLFPQACAVAATPEALAKRRAQEEKRVREKTVLVKGAQKNAEALEGQELHLRAKANEDGTLYAAVSVKDIVKVAKAQGLKLSEGEVAAHDPIKEAGTYGLTAEFSGGFEAEFMLIVEAEA